MRTNTIVRWLAFAALVLSLVSLGLDSNGHSLIAAAVIMSACVALTFSQREIKEGR